VFEVANLFEQQRQNDVSRRLTAGAAILAVPTMIFGLYGMNFEFMPELRWQYGYVAVVAVVVALCVALFFAFRRAKWL
jgi:magnesium transporter